MPVIVEPFKIKSVEPIAFTSRAERLAWMEDAGFNAFGLGAEHVTFDLLTDSGTAAMSDAQWAAIMLADESYAGSRSFHRFEKVVRDLTSYKHVIPTHQGRAAERILFQCAVKPGKRVVSNNHFDTTRANIEYLGGIADDLVVRESRDTNSEFPFKGNVDLERLANYLDDHRGEVALGMATITNNTGGGQPVSLANLRAAAALYKKHGVPFILDACRFAENAYMIKTREAGQSDRSVEEIAQEVFSLADGCTMSGKKDALVNMGGFLAVRDDELARNARNLLILTEGFPTYGGCAARDLEAMATGLREALDERYLEYRLATVRYLANGLAAIGVPTVRPPGGHAVYVDARAFLPHVRSHAFPGQAVVVALYLEGGIRACEIGSVMFGKPLPGGDFKAADLELVRLALPRRRYTQSHVDRIIEIAADVAGKRDRLRGFEMTERPPHLPHFTARFRPENDWVRAVYGDNRR